MTSSQTPSTPGRPVTERRVLNSIGLMRHLLDNPTGVNILVAEAIEALAGRTLMPRIADTISEAETRQHISRRISDFVLGRKSIPHWADHAAREWCTLYVAAMLKNKSVGLQLDGNQIAVSAATSRKLLAEGLVGLVLTSAAENSDRKVASSLQLIDKIVAERELG